MHSGFVEVDAVSHPWEMEIKVTPKSSFADEQAFVILCQESDLHRKSADGLGWSGRRVSNPQQPPWKGGALPIELRPLKVL